MVVLYHFVVVLCLFIYVLSPSCNPYVSLCSKSIFVDVLFASLCGRCVSLCGLFTSLSCYSAWHCSSFKSFGCSHIVCLSSQCVSLCGYFSLWLVCIFLRSRRLCSCFASLCRQLFVVILHLWSFCVSLWSICIILWSFLSLCFASHEVISHGCCWCFASFMVVLSLCSCFAYLWGHSACLYECLCVFVVAQLSSFKKRLQLHSEAVSVPSNPSLIPISNLSLYDSSIGGQSDSRSSGFTYCCCCLLICLVRCLQPVTLWFLFTDFKDGSVQKMVLLLGLRTETNHLSFPFILSVR